MIGVSSCGGSEIADSPVESSNRLGVTEADYEEGARAEQLAIRECMEKAGWPYSEADPDDLIVTPSERGPAWGIAAALIRGLDARAGAGGSSGDVNIPPEVLPSDRDAWLDQAASCSDEVYRHFDSIRQRASSALSTLEHAWDEFHESPDYMAGVNEWLSCMSVAGYDVDDPASVSVSVEFEARDIVEAANGDPSQFDRERVMALQQEEQQLFDADRECRSETIDPLESDFKTSLFRAESDAVAELREATRGD
ncbi:MAG: hypothetical protein QNL12_03315 [Acidimicrobiia bacterium]|nr:hypothetical protein [Acidimicrobiia bacterium]